MENSADIKDSTNSNLIRKHVAAVHIGSDGLSLLGRKSMNAMLMLAREDIKIQYGDVEEYLTQNRGREVNHTASIQDFKTMINYGSRDHARLKTVLKMLSSTPVEFNIFKERQDEDVWEIMSFLSYAKIEKGLVTFRFPSEIREQLLVPHRYATISMSIQNKFGSEYALALYENVVRFVNLGETPWFLLDKLRSALGVPADNYQEYKYLSRKLKSSIKEVNRLSDIEIEMRVKKHVNRVHAIAFKIKRKPTTDWLAPSASSEGQSNPAYIRDLKDLGLTEAQLKKIVPLFDVETLERKTALIIKKIRSNPTIRNHAAFAYSALMQNYDDMIEAPGKEYQDNPPGLIIDENSRRLLAEFKGDIEDLKSKRIKK